MKFSVLLAVCLLFSPLAAQAQTQTGTPAGPGYQPPEGAVEEWATLRDGSKLAANVFKPEGPGPWPVILSRTPYLKDGKGTPESRAALAVQARKYTGAGYVFVLQDVRGKGHSQGFYAAYVNDIEDGYDTVEWAAAQPWSTGKVGVTGASALGVTANAAAMAAPPHLKAAYVVVAPFDRSRSSFMGGVLKDKDSVGWLKQQGVSDAEINTLKSRAADDVVWNRFAMSTNRKYIQIPMYNVGGWYDIFNEGNTNNFNWLQNHGARGARGLQKLMMGPFGHGPLSGDLAYPGEDALAGGFRHEIRWFDYWLKGIDNGVMDEPPVSYFMMAAARKGAYSPKNRWVREANWPPAFREVRYYLTPDKGLTPQAPKSAPGALSYRFDPANPVATFGGANLTFERGPMDQRAVGMRDDYLRFQTPVLTKDVAVAGPVTVELYAATDGPDTDFMAKLVDVYPDGYEALVLDAPLRTRYRGGRMPDDVKMMTPGAPERLVLELWSTALTFEAGHRIALHVTSSNAPRFEVNPNTGEAPGEAKLKPRVAVNTVFMDPAHPSALVLPVIYPDGR